MSNAKVRGRRRRRAKLEARDRLACAQALFAWQLHYRITRQWFWEALRSPLPSISIEPWDAGWSQDGNPIDDLRAAVGDAPITIFASQAELDAAYGRGVFRFPRVEGGPPIDVVQLPREP